MSINNVIKKDGRTEKFDPEKIKHGLFKSVQAAGGSNKEKSDQIADKIIKQLEEKFSGTIKSSDILDTVEFVLLKGGHDKVSRAFILHRYRNEMLRKSEDTDKDNILIKHFLDRSDWTIKENANTNYSLSAMNFNMAQKITQNFWLSEIYTPEIAKAHIDGDFHIHDLGIFGAYCCGLDLLDLLQTGFGGVTGTIWCKPPKHFRTALGQMVNYMYSLQNEIAGAIAFSNFDTLLAPYVRYDKLERKDVKQCIQEFIFNMNVPTRSAMQCMSEDTEILTPIGWKKYNELNIGDEILNLNINTKNIEKQKIRFLFKKHYSGEMYNLKNRIQDQLISPNHRVVRQVFNTDKYIMESIEDIINYKSPVIIPISGNNLNKEIDYSDNEIKLIAWLITEGCSRKDQKVKRITITQSKLVNLKKYSEIKSILKKLKLSFSEQNVKPRLGKAVINFDINSESSMRIRKYFDDFTNIKHIPKKLLNMSERQAKLFLETFIKGDGHENCKITSTELKIIDSLQHIATLAGYGSTVLERPPTEIGNKKIFVLRLIKHKTSYIMKIKKINYNGIIWCPNTKNETVIARRNNKIFITGNTPFSNLSFDLECPVKMKKDDVYIGGKSTGDKYGDFQREMDLINDVFCEVLLEGDGNGRVFTFPIPTYNITNQFEWDNPKLDNLWKLTAKYGSPTFVNYLNSSMSPDDSRSFCCRLKSSLVKIKYRGNGLFGSYPLVGSLGVCSINMPRLGYLYKDEKIFFEELEKLLNLAKESLILKRKTIEKYTEEGLYPFIKQTLRNIKLKTGEYWANHFSTLGLLGMDECLLNMGKPDISTPEGVAFSEKVLDFFLKKCEEYEKETGVYFNIEAAPGEGTTRRFANLDKKKYPNILVANEENYKKNKMAPYYSNSTQLKVGANIDLFTALKLQEPLQIKYTGGTIFHIFLGESSPSPESIKNLIKKCCENYKIPYYAISPTFSICGAHGYLKGRHKYCPLCLEPNEVIPNEA